MTREHMVDGFTAKSNPKSVDSRIKAWTPLIKVNAQFFAFFLSCKDIIKKVVSTVSVFFVILSMPYPWTPIFYNLIYIII